MRALDKNVYLVGPMGSGKTTVGQRVAALLGLEFVDCDHELEDRTGASVALIFDIEGEAGFRDRETRMLSELTAREGILLATGGGVILRAENRRLLADSGLVVYLSTSVQQQLRRLGRDRSRPLLQTPDRRAKLLRLAEERNPLYREIADIEFPAQNRTLDAVARDLAGTIRRFGSDE
ncbi:MAG: shikimate kinase AroK [Gammaproteobacteria bacterium]|nr:shikimate kinase AroK [Gammaproteobacteria bacterium]MBT8055681.1 shikimate kinase AroK [Gammaproteobacteria bacterium]